MNREQRRKSAKMKPLPGVVYSAPESPESKDVELNKPATIEEVVKIATAVSTDMVNAYHKQNVPLMVSMSIHTEILKQKMVESGLVKEEEFDQLFKESIDQYNEQIKSKAEKDREEGKPPRPIQLVPETIESE